MDYQYGGGNKMRKLIKIEIEMEFPNDFIPPEKFDESLYSKCGGCPFYIHFNEYAPSEYCNIGGEEECPIKKCFNQGESK